jgi:hypothetical protein
MTAPILIIALVALAAQAAIFGPLAAVRYTAGIAAAIAAAWLAFAIAAA